MVGIISFVWKRKRIKSTGSYSVIPAQILKGKNIKRIFWAVADIDNLDEIEKMIVMEK